MVIQTDTLTDFLDIDNLYFYICFEVSEIVDNNINNNCYNFFRI